jgi:toxin FitB
MESLLLDTNVLSELMRPQPDQAVMDWFAERTGTIFYVSAITQAEIMLCISLLPAGKRRDFGSGCRGDVLTGICRKMSPL